MRGCENKSGEVIKKSDHFFTLVVISLHGGDVAQAGPARRRQLLLRGVSVNRSWTSVWS